MGKAVMQQFSMQVERLVALKYPQLLDIDEKRFRSALAPLMDEIPDSVSDAHDLKQGSLSFVIVINSLATPVSATLPLIERRGKSAIEKLYPIEPAQFQAIDEVDLPRGNAYLLLDIDRGGKTLNITPDAALESINQLDRSPLTIAEGISVLTHCPEFLQPNNGFSLLASRCGDKRVPALWLSEGRPKLGWCWAGNPHTWLGSASCAKRSYAVNIPVMQRGERVHGNSGAGQDGIALSLQ
jgi:hypothetical protein